MNYHSPALHTPAARMSKREEKDPLSNISNLRKPRLTILQPNIQSMWKISNYQVYYKTFIFLSCLD